MSKLFLISEEEKNRILNLHESATSRQYLSEQIVDNYDSKYDYKKEGNNFFYKVKGTDNWIKPTGNALSAIQTKVFGGKQVSKPLNSLPLNDPSSTYLIFNGNQLNWMVNGKVVKSWKAVSGRTKFNTFGDKDAEQALKKYGNKNSEFMKIKEQGPIPIGTYTISQIQKRTNGNATQLIQGKSQKQLHDIMMSGNKHDWNSGEAADLVAWGDYRLPISKIGETDTFGRGSFYIHGGGIPGSIGCIDLMLGMNDFANYFTEWKSKPGNKKLKLVVKY